MKKHITLFLLLVIISNSLLAYNIISGQSYQLTSAAQNNRSLFVKSSSLSNDADVVIWTKTQAPAHYWIVTQIENNLYQLTNSYSNKILYRKGLALDGAKITQYDTNTQSGAKWEIIPVANKDGYFYIIQSQNDGTKLYLETLNTNDASEILLRIKKEGVDANRQQWKFETVTANQTVLTQDIRDILMQGWKNKYYKSATSGYVLGEGGWWGDAEMFEVVLDAYETTGNSEYETMFRQLYVNFLARNKSNWLYNDFNDDIAWMVIASARAYLMFGDPNYLSYAKTNFDMMYARALLPSGMLRWKETAETPNGTNSCINGPAEVASCYLALATGDKAYYEKAKKLYALQRTYLYVPATGQVYDSFTWINGVPSNYNRWASTYNQGTFLGAAVMLYNFYGDPQYKTDAQMIMKYTHDKLCDENGIINVCQVLNSDLAGFKGILMRYVRRFIVDLNKPEYVVWMQKNALHVYANRNSINVCSSAWLTKTPENFIFQDWVNTCTQDCSQTNNCGPNYQQDCIDKNNLARDPFGASTGVSAAFNAPLNKNMISKNAFERIETENFDYLKGVYVRASTDDGTPEIGNIKDEFYTAYNNVNFSTNLSSSMEIRVSKTTYRGSAIEIRLDSLNGNTIGRIDVPRTGDEWQTITQSITPTSGVHKVFLIYKGTVGQSDLFKVNYFKFAESDFVYTDITDNHGIVTSSGDESNFSNLFDNRLDTKYTSQVAGVNSQNWIVYQSPSPVLVKGYSVASADNSPEKDPKSWLFQGSNDGTIWEDIDVQNNQLFDARFQNKKFDINTTKFYTNFRLAVSALNGSQTEMQISEWQIFGTSILMNDITADGGVLTAQFNGIEPDKTFTALTDKNAQSIYQVANQSELSISYKANGIYSLLFYSISSATNSPESDPKDWEVYGSNDGSSWMLIDSRTNQKFKYRNVTQYYNCETTTGYQYFKLHIISTNGAVMTQISEFQLFGKFYYDRFYNDVTIDGGEINSSQEELPNSKNLSALVDNDGNTSYSLNAEVLPAWIQYKSPIPVILRAYSITTSDDDTKNPKSWVLQGSNDGKAWSTVHTMANVTFAYKGERKSFSVSSSTKFSYLRLNITKLSNDNAKEVKIGEWELHGTGTTSSSIVFNGGTSNSQFPGLSTGEVLPKLFDNSAYSKYCFNFNGSAWISYQSISPAKITSYSITSANDSENRDPRSWILEASTNNSTWEIIDSQNNQLFPYRYVTQFYACNVNQKDFTYYRLTISENNGADLLQASEFQLLDIPGIGNVSATEPVINDMHLLIYPNPVSDELHFNMSESGFVHFYNLSGQLILSKQLSSGLGTISLNGFKKGVYIIRINIGQNVINNRIIKL